MYPKWLFLAVLKFCSYNIFYMVIQISNSLFKASLEEKKNEKQKKEGWLARDIFFNFLLLSFLFHENASVFFLHI